MAVATSAHAGTTGSVALTSDYVFRGVSQTDGKPALQGGIEFASEGGFYAGAWGSNVSWLSDLSTTAAPISSSLELDVYGGYRGKFSDAVSYDVGLLYYAYPGDFPAGFNSADRARRMSLAGRSTMVCVLVTSWIVVIEPCLMPMPS